MHGIPINNPFTVAAVCDGLKTTWNNMIARPELPQFVGTSIALACSPGYELSGDKVVTCEQSHNFKFSSEPQCGKL